MPLQVSNICDLERALRNRAAHLTVDDANRWLVTVPRNYLLNVAGDLDDADMRENFKQYHRGWERHALDGVPEVLPGWVEEALRNGQAVFVYNPVQPTGRAFWNKKIEWIVNWFNSRPPPEIDWNNLSFAEALRRAGEWYQENGLG